LAPKTPGQVAWMNHFGGGQDDFRRKPAPKPKPTPAQKGSQTRSRNAARARAAATPDYTPEMQGTGDTTERRRFVTQNIGQQTMNRANVVSGGRVSGTGAGIPKPRPVVRIPSIPEGGINVGARPVASAATPSSSSSSAISKVVRASKVALPKVLGGVAGAVGFLASSDTAGASQGSSETLARQNPKKAREYVDFLQRQAAAKGQQSFDVSPEVYSQATRRTPAPPKRAAAPPKVTAQPAAPAKGVSRMRDYGVNPSGGGKFLRRAYAHNRTAALMTSSGNRPDRAITKSSGNFLPPIKNERQMAMHTFKSTHAWARNAKTAKQKRDVQQAVDYLARTRHKAYFS